MPSAWAEAELPPFSTLEPAGVTEPPSYWSPPQPRVHIGPLELGTLAAALGDFRGCLWGLPLVTFRGRCGQKTGSNKTLSTFCVLDSTGDHRDGPLFLAFEELLTVKAINSLRARMLCPA